jgi:hypothetical protein
VASIPDPRPGLIFRYDYLRPREGLAGVENGTERPACILLNLVEGEIISGAMLVSEAAEKQVIDYTAGPRDVLIVPIQSDPPNRDQLGVKLTIDTKRQIGLPLDNESYVILSEINIDTWPNGGIKHLPRQPGNFAYPGRMPGPLLSAMARRILMLREKRLLTGVIRHP